MTKKYSCWIAWFFFMSVGFSVPAAYARWGSGGVLGVSAGYARTLGQYDTDLIYTARPTAPTLYFNDVQDDNGYFIGGLAGLQAVKKHWLVGVEVRANHFDMDHARYFYSTGWGGSARVKSGVDWGALCRLGYIVAPYFLPYMHVGAETSRDTLEMTFAGGISREFLVQQESRQVYRMTGGVGMEFAMPHVEALSIRIEYMFHLPETALQVSGTMAADPVMPLFQMTVKPRTQSIGGALVWNIA